MVFDKMHLFAYGTLMDGDIMAAVSRGRYRHAPAVLNNYVRKAVRGEVFPAIALCDGGSVDGMVYFGLTQDAFARLDRFEGSLYQRTAVLVTCHGGKSVEAQTYVIARQFTHRLSEQNWDYQEFRTHNKDRFQVGYQGYRVLDELDDNSA